MIRVWVAAALLVACLVLAVEGLDGFALWNLTPVAAALASAVAFRRPSRRATRIARDAFCLTALVLVSLLHVAWQFDWGRMATGSSSAGLIFVFAPLYTVGGAGLVAILVWAVSDLRRGT